MNAWSFIAGFGTAIVLLVLWVADDVWGKKYG